MRTTRGNSTSSQLIDRRSFLRLAGGVGLAAAAAPAISSLAGQDAMALTRHGALNAATTSTFKGTLHFNGWDFDPNEIKVLVREWSRTTHIPVSVTIVPNVTYTSVMETRLRGGEHYDVYYNFAHNSQTFYDAGWAVSLDGLPQLDTIINDMYPSSREHYMASNGRVISVPYYSAVFMVNYNDNFVKRAGFSAPPQSLNEVYLQSKKMKSLGITDTPYVAYWIVGFCEEYVCQYLLSNGVTPFDHKGDPVFADDPKSVDTFEWWQTMYREGLTPKSLLTDDPSQLATYVAKGTAAFLELHQYFLTSIRSANGPQSKYVYQVPSGGPHGTPLQIADVLQMGKIEDPAEKAAAWELMKFYGWKSPTGQFNTFVQWAKAAGLAAPYPAFFTDPAVKAAFPSYYDLPMLSDAFRRSNLVYARTLPWYEGYVTTCGTIVQEMLTGQKTPKKTVAALASAAKKAKSGITL